MDNQNGQNLNLREAICEGLHAEEKQAETSINEFVRSDVYKTATHTCFAVKVKGLSHTNNGDKCQDAFYCRKISVNGKDVIIATVADGHGDTKYPLSGHGADIAVKCMFDIFESYCNKYSSIRDIYTAVKQDFPSELYQMWCESVEKDYANRNIESIIENKNEIHKKYATTAMFCLAIERAFIFGKLDGNITVYKNNEYYEPIKDDNNLIGTEAYSLCVKDHALNKWRFDINYYADFLILSTDGLRLSFGEDDDTTLFYKAISSIYTDICEYGETATCESMPKLLSTYTNTGSGDDITICCIKANSYDKKVSSQSQEFSLIEWLKSCTKTNSSDPDETERVK